MVLKAKDNHKYKNVHTGEEFDSVAVPTGFEGIYQLVEVVKETTDNITKENKSISDRLTAIEDIVDKIIKILPISKSGDSK